LAESTYLGLGFVAWRQHGASSAKPERDLDVVMPTVDGEDSVLLMFAVERSGIQWVTTMPELAEKTPGRGVGG